MAAVLVALGVAGLWFLLGDASEEQGSKTGVTFRSASVASRVTRATPSRKVPPLEARPEKPPDGALEVEVFSKNQPLPGAQVHVYEREPAALSVFPARWIGKDAGTTGADGKWTLPVAPGSYYVTARAEGLSPDYASVVHLPGSAQTHVRLSLEEGVELVGSTLAKGTGDPVSLAEIILTPPAFTSGAREHVDAPEEENLVATSNEVGEFRFSGLAPGRYRIEARAPGYANVALPSAPVPFKGRVTLLMIPGGQLEGTVLGADGQPAAEAEVLILGREQALSVFSDSEGNFALEVPPGTYAVSARKGTAVGALEAEVNVAVGQRVQGLRLQLGDGAWVSGKVVSRDGSRVLGARVEAWPRGLSTASTQAGTDESGAFSLPPLAAGTYTLQVFLPDGFQAAHAFLTLTAGQHVSLTLTADDGPGGRIECRVRDASNHLVRGVQLRASLLQDQGASTSKTLEGRTDATGGFTFNFNALPAGMYRVEALRDGRSLNGGLTLLVEKNKVATGCYFLDISGDAAPEGSNAVVEGQILQHSGAPVDEPLLVELKAQNRRGFAPGSMPVDAQGRFQLAVLPGPYMLKVSRQRAAGCGLAGQRELQVEAGQHLKTTLLLEEPREPTLRLRVLEANGAPAKLTWVKVHTPQSFPEWAQTDEQARLDVCLPPMKQQAPSAPLVTISSFDGERAATVEATSGLGEFTLQLRPLPFVQGRILQPQGLPVGHVILDLFSTSQREASRTYEFVGDHFELPEFPLGPTQLIVTADGMRASLLLNLQPEERKVLEIPVYPSVSMAGRVVDAVTRQPLALVVSPLPFDSQMTGRDGRFSFRNLPAGELLLDTSFQSRIRVKLSPEQDTDLGDIAVHVP